ncbi:hypothetical protein MUK42_36001 [Musa troglodytarum]|uniref:Uncharacterized protein n=1 Tax=Musa troglodytarum TaxID=320322 RepID=A0A9E7H4V6_9LILI|nr:hypothetical protein MUK42_36001 [Musa troglodytarum]
MASKNPSDNTFLFFFFFFSMVFICAICRPGFAGEVAHTNFPPPKHGSRSPVGLETLTLNVACTVGVSRLCIF